MDTMTALKFVGSIVGTLAVFILLKFGAAFLYSNDDTVEAAYVIEVEEETAPVETAAAPASDGTPAEAPVEVAAPTFAELLASADLAAGEKVFKKCKACHKLDDGVNATGPHLFGVVGRTQTSVETFRYSDVFKGLDGTWTPEELSLFLTRPKDYAPGTKMSFSGLKSEEDRANLIAYLATIGG